MTKEKQTALNLILERGYVRTTLFQRAMGLSYAEARAIMDWLEDEEIIKPFNGRNRTQKRFNKSKARELLTH